MIARGPARRQSRRCLKEEGLHMEPILDWEARYHEASVPWEREGLNPAFQRWQRWLQSHSGTAIVPGCGRSPELCALAQLGWRVTGVDLSETAAGFQQQQLHSAGLTGHVTACNLFDWQPAQPADLVYEQTCLCALNPDHWVAYEAQLAQWLRPGGTLLALFMQTTDPDGPPFHCGIDQMQQLFDPSRWEWHGTALRSDHPLGVYELGFRLTRR